MVLYSLKVKALLDNVQSLYPAEDFDWFVKVKCSTCGEDSGRGWHSISMTSEYETRGGRSAVNFVRKCKFCSREGSLSIVKDSVKKLVEVEGSCDFTELAVFDCRGLEPVDFSPMEGWIVVATSGATLVDVDLSANEWVGYDEQGKQPVGVYNFEARFIRV